METQNSKLTPPLLSFLFLLPNFLIFFSFFSFFFLCYLLHLCPWKPPHWGTPLLATLHSSHVGEMTIATMHPPHERQPWGETHSPLAWLLAMKSCCWELGTPNVVGGGGNSLCCYPLLLILKNKRRGEWKRGEKKQKQTKGGVGLWYKQGLFSKVFVFFFPHLVLVSKACSSNNFSLTFVHAPNIQASL